MCSLYNVFKNFKTHKKSKCINKENDSPCVVKKEHIGYKLFVQDKEYDGDIDGLAINVNGSNNNIYISDLENFYNCNIYINSSNNTIRFGKKFANFKSINNLVVIVQNGDNQSLEIGDHTLMWGARVVMDEKNSGLHIGKDCLFSSDISIWTADGHPIFDMETNERINAVSDHVFIDDNVWVGQGARITKNAVISKGCVVGGVRCK